MIASPMYLSIVPPNPVITAVSRSNARSMISCTTSGSSFSLIAVKPEMSAKRIVTVRRSSARGATVSIVPSGARTFTSVREGVAGPGPAGTGAAALSAPPHPPQNLNPGGFSNWQVPHFMDLRV